jgi:hypothetical protein
MCKRVKRDRGHKIKGDGHRGGVKELWIKKVEFKGDIGG